jgi:hypothetical protein
VEDTSTASSPFLLHVPGGAAGEMYREGGGRRDNWVSIDGPSGTHGDDPERDGDTSPEKEREYGAQNADSRASTSPAETRSRAEYYEALRAAVVEDRVVDGVAAGRVRPRGSSRSSPRPSATGR